MTRDRPPGDNESDAAALPPRLAAAARWGRRASGVGVALGAIVGLAVAPLPWHELRHVDAEAVVAAMYFGPDVGDNVDRAQMLERATVTETCTGIEHEGAWPLVALGVLAMAGVALAFGRRPRRIGVAIAVAVVSALALSLASFDAEFLRHLFETQGEPTLAERLYHFATTFAGCAAVAAMLAGSTEVLSRRAARRGASAQSRSS